MTNRLTITAWGSRVYLNFAPPKHPAYIDVPKRPRVTKIGDRVVAESGKQRWEIAPRKDIVVNSGGEPFLQHGKNVIDLSSFDCRQPVQVNFWQLVGGDFRGLQDRTPLSPEEFGQELTKWLANPHGRFSHTTIITHLPYQPILIPFGRDQLVAHSSTFQHAYRFPAGSAFIVTADERHEFPDFAPSIIEFTIYDARNNEAITKWVLARNSKLLYSLNPDRSITYWAHFSPADYLILENYLFVPGASSHSETTLGLRFKDGKLRAIQATNYTELNWTLGAPLGPDNPQPVIVGGKLPAAALAGLNGYFAVEANWRTAKRPVNFWFKKDHYLDADEIQFLGLTEKARKLSVRVERGLVTEIYRADDIEHERPIYLGVRRTANGDIQETFHYSCRLAVADQTIQVIEGLWIKRKRVSRVVQGGQAVFERPVPRFSEKNWSYIKKTWGKPPKPAGSRSESKKLVSRWAELQQGYISITGSGVIFNLERARRNRTTLERYHAKTIELSKTEKDPPTLRKLSLIKHTLGTWLRRLDETSTARTTKDDRAVSEIEPDGYPAESDGLDDLERGRLKKLTEE